MSWEDRAYHRDQSGGIPPVVFSFPKLTRLTMVLIGCCLVLFLVQSLTRGFGAPLEEWGGLTFADQKAFTQPWRWITYQYLHGGAGHFFFNMIGLYFFLPSLEMLWGWRKALAFYTAGGVVAGVVYGLIAMSVPYGRAGILIGASGSIFAALGAVALLSPQRQLILLFFPVPIRVAVALFGAFFLLATVADRDLSNAAHLGGLAFGFFAPWIAGPWWIRVQRKFWERKRKRVIDSELEEQEMVDRILEKVHTQGMDSLSRAERRALKQATERQRRVDQVTARRSRARSS